MDGPGDFNTGAADGDFAKLKGLAREVVAAESADLSLLEQIAALVGELVARCRDEARQRAVAATAQRAAALFVTAADDLTARLAALPLDELTGLGQLLDQADAAQHALAEADSALTAAHRKSDFAAMAPLALEADRQQSVLAATAAQFASRTGAAVTLRSDAAEPETPPPAVADAVVAAEPAAAATPPEAASAELPAATTVAAPAAPADNAVEASAENEPRPSATERRRLRDLIRQVRPVAEEGALT